MTISAAVALVTLTFLMNNVTFLINNVAAHSLIL